MISWLHVTSWRQMTSWIHATLFDLMCIAHLSLFPWALHFRNKNLFEYFLFQNGFTIPQFYFNLLTTRCEIKSRFEINFYIYSKLQILHFDHHLITQICNIVTKKWHLVWNTCSLFQNGFYFKTHQYWRNVCLQSIIIYVF